MRWGGEIRGTQNVSKLDIMSIDSNIILEENEAFGSPNYEVVRAFLYMVDKNMMTAIGRPFFSTQKCFVTYKEECPMCAKIGDNHIVFLNVKDNYWCQWVYQFAHEYCHHLINGPLSGDWSPMLWFEETVCELSSMYNLYRMVGFCEERGLKFYSPSVQEYLNNLLTKNNNVFMLSYEGGWYQGYKELLSTEHYNRELYNAIAALMYPLFIENPNLWKIILNIGDIRSWRSFDDLLVHLQVNSEASYSDSWRIIQKFFS